MRHHLTAVDLNQAYRLMNHGPTVLISSAHQGTQNVMAAAWVCALDFDPPKITAVIDKNTYTRSLIEAAGSFVINVPCVAQIDVVQTLGTSSGRDLQDTDKLTHHQLTTFTDKNTSAPLIAGCVAWLVCKIIPEPKVQQTYDLWIAEVVAAYADARVFSEGKWHFAGHDDLRTIHHVAGGAYFATGDLMHAQTR